MLGDWLLKSGARSDEQMVDLEGMVFRQEWLLPHDSPHGMLIYAMVQELATWVHYRNLRQRVEERGDPVLSRLLRLIAVDERSHHAFYHQQVVQVFLRLDRGETLEQLRRVLLTFSMPAVYLLAESRQRVAAIRGLGIFDEDVFSREVYHPILEALGVHHRELRQGPVVRKSQPSGW